MARFTTDFLTWLKGLFHTKTEVNTLLDKKINTVEVQGKITSFTNKDRITIERLIERMNNPDSKALFLRPTDSDLPYYTFCENIKVGRTNSQGVSLYLDGAAIGTSASSVVLKKIDGTKIGDFNKRGTDPAGWGYSLSSMGLGVGIHYLYAEATFPDGSVRKSNILTVFVKENQNALNYNVWSAGEYENNTNGIYRINENTEIITNKEYSNIGENSYRVKIISSSPGSLIVNRMSHEANKTITASLNIRAVSGNLTLRLQELSISNRTDVIVSEGSIGAFSVSHIVSSTQNVQFMIIPEGQGTLCYIDNISLTTS